MDDEVEVPDHCWKEKRRNDGRKWILNYGKKLSVSNPLSTMKEGYTKPQKVQIHEGRRKELFKKQLLKEITVDILREQAEPSPVEEYCTTYDNHYQKAGFCVNDDMFENPELHAKYPLYRDMGLSVWQDKIQKRNKGLSKIVGVSKTVNPLKSFVKNDTFTKPVPERLDESEI